jgi:hypothetical protein
MFKPQVRTIIFDAQGINTTVGKKSGSVEWREVQSVEDTADNIVIVGRT